MHNVMIFGAGDLGLRIADALLLRGQVRELTLVDLPDSRGAESAKALAACHVTPINFEGINALNPGDVEQVVRRHKPDMVIPAASLRNPHAVMLAGHHVTQTLWKAGMGVQLAYQFPILYSVMQGVKAAAPDTKVVNATVPDITNHILNAKGLAPTAGLGNTCIIEMRVRVNLLREQLRAGNGTVANLPKVRVIGGMIHTIGFLLSQKPDDASQVPLIYLGEEDIRANEVLYAGVSLETCPKVNMATTIASLPMIEALLPGAADCYTSMPGPLGMLGGYPVKISNQKIELDLPSGVSLENAEAFNLQSMPDVGIERVDSDGTVFYTETAKRAMADLEPRLTEPYNPLIDSDRTAVLLELVDSIN